MELLAGYASSSSNNSSCCSLLGNDQHQPSSSSCSNSNSSRAGSSKDADKMGSELLASAEHEETLRPNEKKRRRLSNGQHNPNDAKIFTPKFERNHPHWEGRWVGHLHLPFPPLEQLDCRLEQRRSDDDDLINDMNGFGEGNELSTHEHSDDYDNEHPRSSSDASCSDDSDDNDCGSSSSGEESDGIVLQSRMFLPTSRKLIHHWEMMLQESTSGSYDECKNATFDDDPHEKRTASALVVVPHIPMHPIGSTLIASSSPTGDAAVSTTLHISLARPIYLPTPSVDSFMTCIEKSIQAVLLGNTSGGGRTQSHQRQRGRILQLQPHNTTIFTNDQQNRSFLSIPISKESSRWVKQTLLPPIDAAMVRFGLETYYHNMEGGDGCILHVSVASVKGNVIPQLLQHRTRDNTKCGMSSADERSIRSLPLFVAPEELQKSDADILLSIPSCIPIRFDRIQCTFGKEKQVTILI